VVAFPLASRPGTVSGRSADCAGIIKVLRMANEETNVAVHDKGDAIGPLVEELISE